MGYLEELPEKIIISNPLLFHSLLIVLGRMEGQGTCRPSYMRALHKIRHTELKMTQMRATYGLPHIYLAHSSFQP